MMMRSDIEIINPQSFQTSTTTTENTQTESTTNNTEDNTQTESTTTEETPTTEPITNESITIQTSITRTDTEQSFINKINKDYQFYAGFKRDAADISIKYLQYFLKSQGFYQETINGINTEATITALFEWQKTKNILTDPTDPAA
jgi:hypothetical protein